MKKKNHDPNCKEKEKNTRTMALLEMPFLSETVKEGETFLCTNSSLDLPLHKSYVDSLARM